MTGLPSIVAGLFIYAFWVIGLHQGFSGLAAGVALSVLMLPVVVRASEEMLKLVPNDLREASYGLGIPRWRTIVSVVLPAASSRAHDRGDARDRPGHRRDRPAAPDRLRVRRHAHEPAERPQSSLPLYVFQQAFRLRRGRDRAWAGALTLIAIVLLLTMVARLVTRRNRLVT